MGANTIFGYFLPFILLVVLNILIMWTLRKNKQESIITFENNGRKIPFQKENSSFYKRFTYSFRSRVRRDDFEEAVSPHDDAVSPCAEVPSPISPPLSPGAFQINSFEFPYIDDEVNSSNTKFTQPRGSVKLMVTEHHIKGKITQPHRKLSQNGLIRHGGNDTNTATETKLTWISFYIILMYLICNIWKLIPNVYEAIHGFNDDGLAVEWPDWLNWFNELCHIMVVINSAFNSVPYLLYRNNASPRGVNNVSIV